MQPLLTRLQTLEVELHHPGIWCSAERLEQILHPQFHEVGRSGRRYDRATIIRFLGAQEKPPAVETRDFAVHPLADGCALLTYESWHKSAEGTTENRALRSSVWLETSVGWQLYYHQGTPSPLES